HRLDIVRNAFLSPPANAGAGVKIGVISDNVDHLSDVVTSGDAPNNVNIKFRSTDPADAGDEGTALIEVLHDIVPGASIEFYGPTTSAEMVTGINTLKGDGCQIILDDLTFLDEPKFEDGIIAQAVKSFIAGGGIYVTSAGNDSQDHYIGNYNQVNN